MSFPKRRQEVMAEDRELEQKAGVRKNDPEASRFAGGNVYSRADIAELEKHHTKFWRRRKKHRDGD